MGQFSMKILGLPGLILNGNQQPASHADAVYRCRSQKARWKTNPFVKNPQRRHNAHPRFSHGWFLTSQVSVPNLEGDSRLRCTQLSAPQTIALSPHASHPAYWDSYTSLPRR